MPLGTITLSITFGDKVHYQKETLSFEVIDFEGPYHAILEKSCYAKLMAIPSYAYLKLKMLAPHSVSTIAGSFWLAIEQAQQYLILDLSKLAHEDK